MSASRYVNVKKVLVSPPLVSVQYRCRDFEGTERPGIAACVALTVKSPLPTTVDSVTGEYPFAVPTSKVKGLGTASFFRLPMMCPELWVTLAELPMVSVFAPVVMLPLVSVSAVLTVALAPSVMPPELFIVRLRRTLVEVGSSGPVVKLDEPVY